MGDGKVTFDIAVAGIFQKHAIVVEKGLRRRAKPFWASSKYMYTSRPLAQQSRGMTNLTATIDTLWLHHSIILVSTELVNQHRAWAAVILLVEYLQRIGYKESPEAQDSHRT